MQPNNKNVLVGCVLWEHHSMYLHKPTHAAYYILRLLGAAIGPGTNLYGPITVLSTVDKIYKSTHI